MSGHWTSRARKEPVASLRGKDHEATRQLFFAPPVREFRLTRKDCIEGCSIIPQDIPLHSERVTKNGLSARLVDEVSRQETVLVGGLKQLLGNHQPTFVAGPFPHRLAQKPLEVLDAKLAGSRLMHHSNDNQNGVPSAGIGFQDGGADRLDCSMKRLQAFRGNVSKIVGEVPANGVEVGFLSVGTKCA